MPKSDLLTPADRKAIRELEADALQRSTFVLAQAERLARVVVPQATDRLVGRVVAIGDERLLQRGVYAAVAEERARLVVEFRRVGIQIRDLARKVALGQVETEAKQVKKDLTAIAGREYPFVPVLPAPDTRAGDEHWAEHAANAVAQRWSAIALSAFTTWQRKRETPAQLHRRLQGVAKLAEKGWRGHIKNAVLYAYQDETKGAWRSILERDPRSGFKP